MTKASDNEYPSVLLDEQASAPTTPATGFWRVYAKADGLYIVDDAGVETGPLSSGGGGAEGVIGYAEVTTGQQNIQVETDLTGLSVTVNVGTGRRIRITGSGILQKTDNAGWFVGYIKESTTYLGRWTMENRGSSSGYARGEASVVLDSPSNGSHTYKLSLEAQNIDVDLLAAAAYPAFILVEDIGAA